MTSEQIDPTLKYLATIFYDLIRKDKKRYAIDKRPSGLDTSRVNLSLVSTESDQFPSDLEDRLRNIVNVQKGIYLREVKCKRVPRWHFTRRVIEWEEALGMNLGFGVGDPHQPKVYFNNLLGLGKEMRSSDIHIYPSTMGIDNVGVVELRIDGVCRRIDTFNLEDLAGINREIHRRCLNGEDNRSEIVQGCFRQEDAPEIDYRATSISTGENSYATAIRMIQRQFLQKHLSQIGFLKSDISRISELLSNDSGFIAVVGPTGAGKTTTAYSILNEYVELTRGTKRVLTFESPIESRARGVTHIRVSKDSTEKGILSYKDALQISLRLDPDFVFVGEALGPETGQYLTDVAQTAHLYMMTMHAENAAKAIGRLSGWDIGARTLNDTLLGIISQKLCKRNCPHCSKKRKLTEEEIDHFFPRDQISEKGDYDQLRDLISGFEINESRDGKKEGDWCIDCQGTGFLSRVPLVEIYTHALANYGIVARICNKDTQGDMEMHDLLKNGTVKPMGLNALQHMLMGEVPPTEIRSMFPKKYFREYAPLVARKVSDYILSSKAK